MSGGSSHLEGRQTRLVLPRGLATQLTGLQQGQRYRIRTDPWVYGIFFKHSNLVGVCIVQYSNKTLVGLCGVWYRSLLILNRVKISYFCRTVPRSLETLTGLEAIGQADGASALSLEADKLLVADSLVGLHDGGWTVGSSAVTVALVPAAVIFPTQGTHVIPTVPGGRQGLQREDLLRKKAILLNLHNY